MALNKCKCIKIVKQTEKLPATMWGSHSTSDIAESSLKSVHLNVPGTCHSCKKLYILFFIPFVMIWINKSVQKHIEKGHHTT